jgi:hypothetical protein
MLHIPWEYKDYLFSGPHVQRLGALLDYAQQESAADIFLILEAGYEERPFVLRIGPICIDQPLCVVDGFGTIIDMTRELEADPTNEILSWMMVAVLSKGRALPPAAWAKQFDDSGRRQALEATWGSGLADAIDRLKQGDTAPQVHVTCPQCANSYLLLFQKKQCYYCGFAIPNTNFQPVEPGFRDPTFT